MSSSMSDSNTMPKILQARLQSYVNQELPDVQAGFRKGRGTRGQIASICWIIEKAREFQKNIHFCFIKLWNYAKAFDCVDHNRLWKILKEMGILNSSVGKESTCKAGDPYLVPGSARSTGEGIGYPLQYSWASFVAQVVKNPPVVQETWVQSLGW